MRWFKRAILNLSKHFNIYKTLNLRISGKKCFPTYFLQFQLFITWDLISKTASMLLKNSFFFPANFHLASKFLSAVRLFIWDTTLSTSYCFFFIWAIILSHALELLHFLLHQSLCPKLVLLFSIKQIHSTKLILHCCHCLPCLFSRAHLKTLYKQQTKWRIDNHNKGLVWVLVTGLSFHAHSGSCCSTDV